MLPSPLFNCKCTSLSCGVHSWRELTDRVHSEAASPPQDFNLPEGILVPAHLLLANKPTPSQLALITPYKPHWTSGAYFVVFIAGISIACLYIFFLFQFADMLRNKAGSDSLPVIDRRRLKFEQQEPGWNRRFSWAAGLEGMDQEGGGSESGYGGSEKGKERELERDRPSAKVVHALRLKQIPGPSPVQEELKEEISMKEFKELSINTACSEASGSGSVSGSSTGEGSGSGSSSGGGSISVTGDGGEGFREELEKMNKRASTQSQNGTWPRSPGSFPRLSFTPKSPKSPSHRVTPGTPRTPGGRSMKGYF
jgi:hypothetical protein